MINWGKVPLASVLPFPFDSFDGGTGASITMTGLVEADIRVYKGTSMTQRSSTSGFVLLETDGIDIDTLTGIHGFSIDTGDNTDAGFFVAGSFYYVVVSSVTIDAQTVNFVAGTFWLGPTLTVAGVDEVDVTHWLGTACATPTVNGVPKVDLTHVAGATTNVSALATNVDAILTDTAEIGVAGAGLNNINLPNQTMDITGNITGNLSGSVGSVTGAVGSVTGSVGSVTGAVGSVTADVGITQVGADKVWTSAVRTLTAFSTTLALLIWDVLETAILTANSIGLKLKNNLDTTTSSRLATSGYTAPDNTSITAIKAKTDTIIWTDITDIKDANLGKWSINKATNVLTMYKADGITVLKTFNLTDNASVSERVPV